MNQTCDRCGSPIEQVHYFEEKPYGSTCIKIVVRERHGTSLSSKIGPGCFDKTTVLKCAEIYRKGKANHFSYEMKQEIRKELGTIGFNILAGIILGNTMKINEEAIPVYYNFREWLKA